MEFQKSELNPYRELVADMTPVEFEKVCVKIIEAYAEEENLSNFTIIHDAKVHAYDGVYQIDALAEFTAMNCKFKVLIECKQYSHPIERKIVAELYTKIQSTGAHKGLIISTCGYQSGAVEYACAHGISLLQISSTSTEFVLQAYEPSRKLMYTYQRLKELFPKYVVNEWDKYDWPSRRIFPTTAEQGLIYKKIQQEIQNGALTKF